MTTGARLLARAWDALRLALPWTAAAKAARRAERDARYPALEFNAEAFRHMERYLATAEIDAGPVPRALPAHPDAATVDQAAYDAFNTENGTNGMIVVHQGKVRFEGYYQGADPHSRFTSWSVAKSVTAMLAAVAQHRGDIADLEDPIIQYAPEFSDTAYRDVRFIDAITMSSGVAFSERYGEPDADIVAYFDAATSGRSLAYLQTLTTKAAEPFTRFNYSSAETQVVGLVIEAATQTALPQYLSTHVWKPMGAEASATWCLDGPQGASLGGFGINARLRDFARFGLWMLDEGVSAEGGAALPDDYLKTATTPRAPHLRYGVLEDGGDFGYGDGWWLSPWKGAFMGIGVFGQFLILVPEAELVVVVMSAWDDPWDEKREGALFAFLEAQLAALVPQAETPPL